MNVLINFRYHIKRYLIIQRNLTFSHKIIIIVNSLIMLMMLMMMTRDESLTARFNTRMSRTACVDNLKQSLDIFKRFDVAGCAEKVALLSIHGDCKHI